jgi:uncharacterized protein (DUF1015 family)
MSTIKPFRAYRPAPGLERRTASVPYDVVNASEARELAAGNPHSFLHVTRPEINMPAGTDEHIEPVYAAGAAALRRMLSGGHFVHEDREAFYVYRQTMNGRSQDGVVCLCSVGEYERGLIKRHEHTRRVKEDDRARHVAAQRANAEPVFLAHRSRGEIGSITTRVCSREPLFDFVSDDGIGHAVWRMDEDESEGTVSAFASVPSLYIADGHHRTAAAVRYGQSMRGGAAPADESPFEWFMAVVFPHDRLMIMDYNRVVRDLNGMTEPEFLSRLGENFKVREARSPRPAAPAEFGMYLGGKWRMLSAHPGTCPAADPVKSLDVSILQDNLLSPVLGIRDPRTDDRIDFVGGIRGTAELERRVNEGWAAAFTVFPASLDQLMAVADAGEVMPPKSTWFEPKLRSGLLVRVYE